VQIKLSKASSKFLQKMGSDKLAKQIAIKIKQLAANGHLNDSKQLKANLVNYHRTDVGEFRIIYKIENNELLIPIIGKRNDSEVYKIMERKNK